MHHGDGGVLAVLAVGGAIFMAVALVMLTILGISMFALWKVFVKAGKPGWAALVPVYNAMTLMEIVGLPPMLGLIVLAPLVMFIPFVGWLIAPFASLGVMGVFIFALYRLSKAFGCDQIGMILLVIPGVSIVGLLMLALGDKEYLGAEAAN